MSAEPFQIYQVAGYRAGTLGLCKQPATDADFALITGWDPRIVITLTGENEFPEIGVSLPQRFLEAGFDWLHLPVIDFGVPAAKDNPLWHEHLAQMLDVLCASGKILIHCKGGNGRSGMLLLKLLIMQGEDSIAALSRLRAVRAGAVETDAQNLWATMPL